MRLSTSGISALGFFALYGLTLVLAVFASEVRADDAIATWEPVTERVDGTPIDGEVEYSLRLKQDSVVVDSAVVTDTQHIFTGLNSGPYDVEIATVEDGRSSDVITRQINAAPKAPALTVIINIIQ